MSHTFSVLYSINHKLTQRMNNGAWYYALCTGFLILFITTFTLYFLFITQHNNAEFQFSINFIVFMVVLFDISAIILRFYNHLTIEPKHLALLPISKWEKFQIHFALYLTDYKSIIYVSAIILFVIYFLTHSLYLSAFISVLLWIILYATLLSWTILLYFSMGPQLDKHRNKLQIINFFFIMVLFCVNIFGDYIITKFPVTSYTGNALYGLTIIDLHMVWINGLLLICGMFLPLLLILILRFRY